MNKAESFLSVFGSVSMGLWKILQSPVAVATAGGSAMVVGYFGSYHLFVEALLICILADSIFGVWLAYKSGVFEWSKATKIIEKIVVYAFYLLMVHFVSRIRFLADYSSSIEYLTSFLYTIMILNEARSAFRNGHKVYPNKIAGWVVNLFDRIEGNVKAGVN